VSFVWLSEGKWSVQQANWKGDGSQWDSRSASADLEPFGGGLKVSQFSASDIPTASKSLDLLVGN
jgi:hypothetical protein